MPRPRRRFQLTCTCPAYSFPHRLGGGRCREESWAEAYYIFDGEACLRCNCNHDGLCDVAGGAESIHHCEAWLEANRTQHDPKPTQLESIYHA